MAQVNSPLWVPTSVGAQPTSTTSTGTTDIKTIAPPAFPSQAPNAVWISVEGVTARVTFDGTSPGNGTGPGLVIPAGSPPQLYPIDTNRGLKFASATAGSSVVSVLWVN